MIKGWLYPGLTPPLKQIVKWTKGERRVNFMLIHRWGPWTWEACFGWPHFQWTQLCIVVGLWNAHPFRLFDSFQAKHRENPPESSYFKRVKEITFSDERITKWKFWQYLGVLKQSLVEILDLEKFWVGSFKRPTPFVCKSLFVEAANGFPVSTFLVPKRWKQQQEIHTIDDKM